jgi:hypothetical protein
VDSRNRPGNDKALDLRGPFEDRVDRQTHCILPGQLLVGTRKQTALVPRMRDSVPW